MLCCIGFEAGFWITFLPDLMGKSGKNQHQPEIDRAIKKTPKKNQGMLNVLINE